MKTNKKFWFGAVICMYTYAHAQYDSSKFSFHFQQTLVSQYHPEFHSPYAGDNSLQPKESVATSLTSTFYFAASFWKNSLFIVNPEVAGGKGLSGATGIAGFPNGEIFRVGNPKPTLYLARLVFQQSFPLAHATYEEAPDEPNTVKGKVPSDYITFYGGRFCLADYFDDNPYSHDPRSQFLNWSFMSAGAWDYAADTRGYTWGAGTEWKRKNWRAALAATMMPQVANGLDMDPYIGKALATQAEITHFHKINNRKGQIQATAFFNRAHMGNYRKTLELLPVKPDVTATADYKNHKWGWVLGASQQLTKNWGGYARVSRNDGINETWAYTEIDRSVNVGFQWSKDEDNNSNVLGIGTVVNGLSKPHRDYLAAGGYGFIIGDGQLTYSPEIITEAYYRLHLFNHHLELSPDYQFVIHPAYNAMRGPVHIFAIRSHIEF